MIKFILVLLMTCSVAVFPENYTKAKSWNKNKKSSVTKRKLSKQQLQKAKKQAPVFLVDTFSDGTYIKNPEWWRFGNLFLSVENNTEKAKFLGGKSLRLRGDSEKWYVGGCGSFLGLDMGNFSILKMVIYSPKPSSALLKIELYDDDNKNTVVDVDSITGKLMGDDVFVYNLMLDWKGWKVVTIPLTQFRDNNLDTGDNVWNPYKVQKSGGLLQMQILAFSSKNPKDSIDIKIDSIKFN